MRTRRRFVLAFKTTFKRLEKKFILTEEQYLAVKAAFEDAFVPDRYGETTICNLYYDTADYILLRRSISKPVYKEKIRLRTYGIPNDSSVSFIELKKKYEGVVYKRRIELPYPDALNFLSKKYVPENQSQIMKELSFCLERYEGLAPRFFISSERSAFFNKDNDEFRVTFDKNLTWRNYDLDLRKGVYGNNILPKGHVIMEIKIPHNLPLWIVQLFSRLGIKSGSFSKVGTAYSQMIKQIGDYNNET